MFYPISSLIYLPLRFTTFENPIGLYNFFPKRHTYSGVDSKSEESDEHI